MKRRELFRRTWFGAVGAAVASLLPGRGGEAAPAAREFPPDYDASRELARPDWKPVFLSRHQDETLTVLGELIVPATDTPGAKEALVNRFIDHLLAAEAPETQKAFLESLFFFDGECLARYGSAFVHLPTERKMEFLNLAAYPHGHVNWGGSRPPYEGYRHFQNLKGWITRAYYSSEVGMRELGWEETHFHADFEGCTHPEGAHR